MVPIFLMKQYLFQALVSSIVISYTSILMYCKKIFILDYFIIPFLTLFVYLLSCDK